jgi:hypothetical protein
MLRSTHKIIAEKIANCLALSTQGAYLFVDGTLGPDTHGDFPHNTGKNSKILQKIEDARQLFFLNDDCAYGELGNALHFIQDRWVDDIRIPNEASLFTDDQVFLEKIKKTQMSENLKQQYIDLANMLIKIKDNGIDSWFNHQWAIWHIDYASCVYVFADVMEMMLPTLQPDVVVANDKMKLEQYFQSEAFKLATQEGFFASLKTNYLYPKIQGYTAAMFTLSQIKPSTDQSHLELNFQIAYRLSQEIARYTLAKPEQFKHQDNWTRKTNAQQVKVGSLRPHYLTLIKQSIDEVHKERLIRFLDEKQKFLTEWPNLERAPQTIQRSETWKNILSELVQILKSKK